MDNHFTTTTESKTATAAGPDVVSLATANMLTEAQQKFHENRLGTKTIQSVKQTANGYEVALDDKGHHSTLKFGKYDVGSATTLAEVGPDIYEHLQDARAFGNRALLTGGALSGALQTGWKEWSTKPGKALGDTTTNVMMAAGFTVGAEAFPLATGTVGAGLLGWGGAQLYHAFPDFAKRTNTVKNFYDRAGHADGATILNQAHQTAELIGPDLFHGGSTVLGVALGGRLGAGMRSGTGNLEANVAEGLKAGAQNFVDTMKDAPAILSKALTPQEVKLAFANAMSGDTSLFENRAMPGIFRSVGRVSEGTEESAEISALPKKFVNQIDESALKQYREAKTPEDLFPGEDDWTRAPGGWVRNSRASESGTIHKIRECFAPGSHYSIAYEGPAENTVISYDFETGKEVTQILPVEDYEAIYKAFQIGEGKVYPKPNFTRPNPRK